MDKLHRSTFLKEVKGTFPEVRDALNQQYGLLHLEMHAFRDFVQELIDSGKKEKLIEALQLLDRYLIGGNSDMVNAIAVSLLEHLSFEDGKVPRAWARALMPTAVEKQLEAITAYNEELAKKKSI